MIVKEIGETKLIKEEYEDKIFLNGSYYSTWLPNKKYYDDIYKVRVEGIDGFMFRSNTGLHNDPETNRRFSEAELIVDLNTGKVIDVYTPNYFYEYTKHYATFTPYN